MEIVFVIILALVWSYYSFSLAHDVMSFALALGGLGLFTLYILIDTGVV